MKFSIWPSPSRPVQEVLDLARMGDTDGWYCFWYADHYMENTGDESFKAGRSTSAGQSSRRSLP